MQLKSLRAKLFLYTSLFSMASQVVAPAVMAAPPLGPNDLNTKTPIKHVIVIYGENRSFDHLFATYRSPSGDSVWNALSEGIINEDGTPGPNYSKATQYQASAPDTFSVAPPKTGAYQNLATADGGRQCNMPATRTRRRSRRCRPPRTRIMACCRAICAC